MDLIFHLIHTPILKVLNFSIFKRQEYAEKLYQIIYLNILLKIQQFD